MKLLTLLLTTATAASAATLPLPLPPTRPRDAPQYRLLHTLTPSPPSNLRLLAAGSASTESTKGGAVLTLPSTSSNNTTAPALSSVQATFRIPHANPPTTGPTANNPVGLYAASFWVGIDGITTSSCTNGGATLRAGVDIFYDGTLGGEQSPFAWYQFVAAGKGSGDETGFEGFKVVPGDVVRFTLTGTASDKKEVVVLAENFGGNVSSTDTEGATPVKSVRQVVPVGEGQGLCGREANFVVEDFPLSGLPNVPVALANFTSVTFGEVGVTLGDGSKRDVTGAQVFDVRQQAQGGRLTSCEVVDGKNVKCTRVVG